MDKNRVFKFRIVSPQPRTRFGRFLRLVALIAVVGVFLGSASILAIYLKYAPTLPSFDSIDDYQPIVGTRIYSADNQLIGEFALERRVPVSMNRIPVLLAKAFVAAEDQRFYYHGGLDYIGITQAIIDKIIHPASKLRGASTITQQVAKSLLATHESYESATARSFTRKIREAIFARRLEGVLSKDQILYLYMTQIFLGHKAYGVQAAAEHYFRKNVWDLNLAEMATIAGLGQRPSDYSPVSNKEAARERRGYVLRRMAEEGFISDAKAKAASQVDLKVYPREELYLKVAPYFTEQVRRELVERYGEKAILEQGLNVYTAVNIEYNYYGQQAIFRGLRALDKRQGYRGSLARLKTEALREKFIRKYRDYLGLSKNETLIFNAQKNYVALVRDISNNGFIATVDVAGNIGSLPLATMRWARKPNPIIRWDTHQVMNINDVLKVGDLIVVHKVSRNNVLQYDMTPAMLAALPAAGNFFALEQEPIAQASLMAVDPRTGYVSTQIGGYNFEKSTFNRAVQACREPGSSFKPIVYSAAIDKLDYTASTIIEDKPIIFDDPDNAVRWKPGNAGQEFLGEITLRTALKDSINLPAIRVAEAVGIEDIIKNARRLGITTPLKRELGTAIGSSCTTLYDLINVYTTLSQYGRRRDVIFIRRVVDRYGNILEDQSAPTDSTLDLVSRLDRSYTELVAPKRQALDPQTDFLTVSLLKNVISEGTGIGASKLGQPLAGKTGTTNESYDAWFFAFSRNFVSGVWVGHDKKERPLGVNEQGGKTALPILVDFAGKVFKDYTVKQPTKIEQPDFSPPSGVVQATIDAETGLLARPNTIRRVRAWYRQGSEPTEQAPDKTKFNPDQDDPYRIDTPL
ncbi:MAG: PBP1A family penicillin-binding protein [Deltaproteobacteria bacterium]|nr:PBP1A family penicillin-binding protein [Deltaproteobacteria bacterium]